MRVLIAAGGTAGHINPALAIAGALKKADPTAEIHFAGRKEEHLTGQDVARTDTACNNSGSCTVNTGVRSLCAAQTEFHNTVTLCGVADTGGLCGN